MPQTPELQALKPYTLTTSPAGVQLRLHRMRKHLKEQVADRDAVQVYVCPRCGASYTSLDAPRLFDPAHNGFMCEECGCAIPLRSTPVWYQGIRVLRV